MTGITIRVFDVSNVTIIITIVDIVLGSITILHLTPTKRLRSDEMPLFNTTAANCGYRIEDYICAFMVIPKNTRETYCTIQFK